VINGLNYILDKVGEFGHWTFSGSELEPQALQSQGSFIGRLPSNTGGAGQVHCWNWTSTESTLGDLSLSFLLFAAVARESM
jgi:hypothetical protein